MAQVILSQRRMVVGEEVSQAQGDSLRCRELLRPTGQRSRDVAQPGRQPVSLNGFAGHMNDCSSVLRMARW